MCGSSPEAIAEVVCNEHPTLVGLVKIVTSDRFLFPTVDNSEDIKVKIREAEADLRESVSLQLFFRGEASFAWFSSRWDAMRFSELTFFSNHPLFLLFLFLPLLAQPCSACYEQESKVAELLFLPPLPKELKQAKDKNKQALVVAPRASRVSARNRKRIEDAEREKREKEAAKAQVREWFVR